MLIYWLAKLCEGSFVVLLWTWRSNYQVFTLWNSPLTPPLITWSTNLYFLKYFTTVISHTSTFLLCALSKLTLPLFVQYIVTWDWLLHQIIRQESLDSCDNFTNVLKCWLGFRKGFRLLPSRTFIMDLNI